MIGIIIIILVTINLNFYFKGTVIIFHTNITMHYDKSSKLEFPNNKSNRGRAGQETINSTGLRDFQWDCVVYV